MVAPTANLAGTHHELNPVGLADELRVLMLLILARDRKRRAVALVGAKANGAATMCCHPRTRSAGDARRLFGAKGVWRCETLGER